MTEPHTHVDSRVDLQSPSCEHAMGYAFLSPKELSLFRQLIRDRRSLPIYRADGWVCYQCPFESTDLAVTARHIVRVHGTNTVGSEDRDED